MKRALFLGFALALRAGAQQVILPPAQTAVSAWLTERRTDVQPADMPWNQAQPADIDTLAAGNAMATVEAHQAESPYQWGPFALHFGLDYSLLYGTGVQVQPGQPKDTSVQDLTPALFLQIGSRWSVVYSPTWTFYSDPAFKNFVGQNLSLAGRNSYGDPAVGFLQSYAFSSAPLIETGEQTTQRTYSTSLNAAYPLGGKWSLNATLAQNIALASGLTDTYDWTTSEGFRYQFTPRLDLGIDATGGYTEVDPGANLANYGLSGVIDWHPASNFSFNADAGFERQVFVGVSGGENSPTLKAAAEYSPIEQTKLGVDISRALAASYFANTATKTTGWNVTLSQRILQQLTFIARFGGQKVSYETSGASVQTGRNDSISTFTLGLSAKVLRRLSLGITYQGSSDTSALPGYGFTSRQFGFTLDYHY